MMFEYRVQTHDQHALFSEQFMDGLHLRNGARNTPGTQHLEGAGDHHAAALRLQVNGFQRMQPLSDCAMLAPFPAEPCLPQSLGLLKV